MKPGRELDALIAEKVMGFKSIQVERNFDPYGVGPKFMIGSETKPEDCIQSITRDNKKIYLLDMPHYSENIADAWEVVEWMRYKSGEGCLLELLQNGDCSWLAVFGEPNFKATADTAPHAICLAALKAMGVEV